MSTLSDEAKDGIGFGENMRKPTNGDITLPFNAAYPSPPYSDTNRHAGTDYGANRGDPVFAPHSGKVTMAGDMGTCGKGLDITGGQYRSRLCHNTEILVQVGQMVNEGDVVAKAGDTGAAQGVHSHWVLWDNNVRVDGSKYVTQGGDMVSEDLVRLVIRGAYGDKVPANYEKEVKYWTGRTQAEFAKYAYGLQDYNIVPARQKIADLEKALAQEATILPKGKYLVP